MKENLKTAIESAEQEIQEKEIAKLKGIVKNLLEKKATLEEEKREIEKEISVIKQTIDDFKSGRLDKVKELIEKDSVAKELLPFKIIIINQPVINQPWKWLYQITPTTPTWYTTTASASTNLISDGYTTANYCNVGTDFGTFTTGTYSLNNGRIINL